MNKNTNGHAAIAAAFAGKKTLVAFITGGDPDIETTEKLIIAMAEAGADVIEIGIPFSDPPAEGPVIQAASARALAGGCTVDKLFAMVARVRQQVAIPLLFMGYINPIFVYGVGRFMQKCQEVGISGVIIPDVPLEERAEVAAECAAHGIANIAMVAPTSQERIGAIATNAEGFVYCVSSLGVTGARNAVDPGVADMMTRVKAATSGKTPCAIGFGISTPQQARDMAALADGVIVGSAIVKLVAQHGRASAAPVAEFVRSVRHLL